MLEEYQKKERPKIDLSFWWAETESNRRHKDFQSFALPTELSAPFFKKRNLKLFLEKNKRKKGGFYTPPDFLFYITKAIIAFWVCNLFSASSKMTEFVESATSSTTSSPL